MRYSMTKKIILTFILIFTGCYVMIHLFGRASMYSYTLKAEEKRLYDSAYVMINKYTKDYYYSQTSLSQLQSELTVMSSFLDARILLTNKSEVVIIDTSTDEIIYRELSEYNANLTKNPFLENIKLKDTKGLYYSISIPMQDFSTIKGYMIIVANMSKINERVSYFYNVFDMMYYGIGIVSLLLLFTLQFFFVRPLRQIIKEARKFTIGKSNERITVGKYDEFAELADTLNVIGDDMSRYNEYQKNFIANISHDFRSPLTSIRGYTEAMLDGTIPSDQQGKYLNIIMFETERLTKLTEGILELNNFDEQRIVLNRSVFDINYIIKQTTTTLEGVCKRKRIMVRLFFAAAETYVDADMGKIEQVIHNLLDNAIKFSPLDSKIQVTTIIKGDKVIISVKDNGCGIPKESLTKIWDRFYKTDTSRGRDKKGTGLGLSISKEIILAHGENIDVISTKDVGSEFIFTLRLASEGGVNAPEGSYS